MRKGDAAMIATGLVTAAALFGHRYRPTPDQPGNALYYATLSKPSFRPSGPIIGLAWAVLDPLLCYSGTRLMAAPPSRSRNWALSGWLTAVSGLALYPFLSFGRRRQGAALASVVGMLGGTVATIWAGASVDRKAAGTMLPLAGWLGFAGVLQEEIWRRNR